MQIKRLVAFFLSLVLISPLLRAKDYEQELRSAEGDDVTVKYKVVAKDGQHTIVFDKPEKRLSRDHRYKYEEPESVKIVFFERVGKHGSDVFKYVNCYEEAITVNLNAMHYRGNDNGVVWIDEGNSVNITLLKQEATLSIPVYLAYYKKNNTYEVFARCGTLEIPLSAVQKGDATASADSISSRKRILDVVVATGEDETLSNEDIALQLANNIRQQVGECTSLTKLEDRVKPLFDELVKLQSGLKIVPPAVENAIDIYSKKKEELQQLADDIIGIRSEEDNRQNVIKQARSDLSYVNERLDNIDNLSDEDIVALKSDANLLRRQSHNIDDRQLAEEMNSAADRCDEQYNKMEQAKKRRTIWMVIGGIILAIAMMLGGQVLQHIRNLKSQRGLEEMQNKMMQHAQNEAQRRAQSVMRSKINRAQSQARRKANEAIRDGISKGVNSATKGKKGGISI